MKYLSRGRGYSLFLTPSEAVLTLREARPATGAEARRHAESATGRPLHSGPPEAGRREPPPDVSGADELPGRSHYLVGTNGYTCSADFPLAGSYQEDQAGTDVFVTKPAAAPTRGLWVSPSTARGTPS